MRECTQKEKGEAKKTPKEDNINTKEAKTTKTSTPKRVENPYKKKTTRKKNIASVIEEKKTERRQHMHRWS